jgi:four helix bundle protein
MIGDELRARSRRFAMDVIDLCLGLGPGRLGHLVTPQLLRAGTGVAANHRAATQGRSRKEFVAKLSVVIEEADESEFWLDVLETKGHGPTGEVRRLRQEASELRAIFGKSRATALKRLKQERKRKGREKPDSPPPLP